jgi:hypothetical protein
MSDGNETVAGPGDDPETSSPAEPDSVPEPTDTEHPAGAEQAGRNAENESPA